MGNVHGSMTTACQEYFERFRRNVFVTPKSFLSFLGSYRKLYEQKLAHTRGLASSISSGLAKMNDAKVDVSKMKVSSHNQHHVLTVDSEVLIASSTFSGPTSVMLRWTCKMEAGIHFAWRMPAWRHGGDQCLKMPSAASGQCFIQLLSPCIAPDILDKVAHLSSVHGPDLENQSQLAETALGLGSPVASCHVHLWLSRKWLNSWWLLQGELAIKNVELAAAAAEAEKLLAQISESTTIAEKEKAKVAVIVDAVTAKAQVRHSIQCCSSRSVIHMPWLLGTSWQCNSRGAAGHAVSVPATAVRLAWRGHHCSWMACGGVQLWLWLQHLLAAGGCSAGMYAGTEQATAIAGDCGGEGGG